MNIPLTPARRCIFRLGLAMCALTPTAFAETAPSNFTGFDQIAMREASQNQLDTVFRWKSVAQSEPHPSDRGKVLVSLVPADASEPPAIWNVTHQEWRTIERPPASNGAARVTFLGRFHGGLAPAAVEPSAPEGGSLWGYVDTKGHWVIPPRYRNAVPFVGDVALVAISTREFRLIDRKGNELPWHHCDPDNPLLPVKIEEIGLVRLGRWVWIDQSRWLRSVSTDCKGVRNASYLTDGTRLIPLPESHNTAFSVDGELWRLENDDGVRLWKPSTGFVTLPRDRVPLKPVNANLYLCPSASPPTTGIALHRNEEWTG